MNDSNTTRISRATYENVYFNCPHCQTENILNRVTDLKSTSPISGLEVTCQACKSNVWITTDRVTKASYIMFLNELPELKSQKRYREYVLSLCQAMEMFFTQALINYKLDRNPLFNTPDGVTNLDLYNYTRRELESAWRAGGFVMLRNLFRKEFEPQRKAFIRLTHDSLSDRRAASFKEVNRTKVNELRNMVVHSTAYRPTLSEIEEQDKLEDAIVWLGLYLDVTDSVTLLNKNMGRPKLGDVDPKAVDLAKELYRNRHLSNKSVSDISKQLGISRATLYRYVGEEEQEEDMIDAPSETTHKNYKFYPYLSTEVAFLSFMTDFKDYLAAHPNKANGVYLRSGPKDTTSMLRPREILALTVMANIAMYESGDVWVPGWIVDENGRQLPEDIAHDGGIRCVSGRGLGKFMRFEQTMATEVAADATPKDLEGAIIKEVNRKSARGDKYVEGTALIIFMDYAGKLSDLRKLSADVSHSKYKTIYLVCNASPKLNDFICVVLKNPSDTLGPISVKFNRPDGVAEVARVR